MACAKTGSGIAMAMLALAGVAVAQDAPQGAHPGECYGRARLPGETHVWRERVQVSRGGAYRRTIPAERRWTSARVLVKAAWSEEVKTPAVYRTVYDRVTEPGRVSVVSTPARYRRVVERVMVEPSRLAWVRKSATMAYGGEPGAERLVPTGEVMCRVRLPARYESRVREVMVAGPGRRRVVGPSTVRRVARRELVRPAGVVHRPHPAIYKTVRHAEIVRPARAEWVRAGPSFRTVEHVSGGDRTGWARVLCPDGLAPWAMQRLQGALNARGYDAGPADGVGKPQTYDALTRFQRDHRLAVGPITAESAQALGVTP